MSDARAKAIAICRAVAADPSHERGHYPEAAMRLGMRVRPAKPSRRGAMADYVGEDMDAVELAADAWLHVDPEPLGIEDPNDPRRDIAAAELLESGWNGDDDE